MKRLIFVSNIALLLCFASHSHAQPTEKSTKKTGAASRNAKKGPLKYAEQILGRPLTPEQKKAVRAAGIEQKAAMKPIREKYRADVAKALGLTLAQYEAREKLLTPERKKPRN
jgi:hypothetical protein